MQEVPLFIQSICDDSFRANAVVFRQIRQRIQSQSEIRHVALNTKCGIHLGNLIRKSLVLSVPGFWSTVVRLGHLFEVSRFRTRFKASMKMVLESCFEWVPVQQLPPESKNWAMQKMTLLSLWNDDPGARPSKRFLDLLRLNVRSLIFSCSLFFC